MRRTLVPLALFAVLACDDSSGPSPALTSLGLEPGTLFVGVSDTATLRITGTTTDGRPARAGDATWTSLDNSIATVTAAGLVTGIAQGTTRIIAQAGDVADTADVTVIPLRFNVESGTACSNAKFRTGRVVAVSDHAIVVADTENPAGGFSNHEYQTFADAFDELIHPTSAAFFGEPADIDGNDRVIIFYTSAVNALTPSGSNSYIGGFFFARDLFPKTPTAQLDGCAGSNEAEMFYMLVPDPNGSVNGNERTKEFVSNVTLGTIAHEYQHLINASRRIFVNNATDFEDLWLNEGLSHIAEELVFFQASALTPRQNVDVDRIRSSQTYVEAFNAYQGSNFGRLSRYYEDPENSSGYSDSATVENRAASWQFLRYVADRSSLSEFEFWNRLVNSTTFGIENLEEVAGQEMIPFYRDWRIATYTDDAVPTTDGRFSLASFDYHSIVSYLYETSYRSRTLTNGSPTTVQLKAGGATYLRFAVPALGTGEVHTTAAGTGASQTGCSGVQPLTLAVGEVVTYAPGEGELLCIEGGTLGSDYLLVPAHLSLVPSSTLGIDVTAFGIGVASTASIAADVAPRADRRFGRGLMAFAGIQELAPVRLPEMELRRREIEELSPKLGGSRRLRAFMSIQPQAVSDQLYLSIVRTH